MSEWGAKLKSAVSKDPGTSPALHAVELLTSLLGSSGASTLQELHDELEGAAESFHSAAESGALAAHRIQLLSCCDIFRRSVTRMDHAEMALDIGALRALQRQRAEGFLANCRAAHARIASALDPFLRDDSCVLVHGYDDAVLNALLRAASTKRLRVLVTEARPDCAGYRMLASLRGAKDAGEHIAAELVLDAGVGSCMHEVDVVLCGAAGVTESGGVINTVGTYQVAVLAHALRKPVHVAAETFKFLRAFPLDQSEVLQPSGGEFAPVRDAAHPLPAGATVRHPEVDYTPPQYIAQLHTDLGVLTPPGVADELIKLYT